MKINRNNCEAWFLDYYEGNLSDGQVQELFAFLETDLEMRELFDSYEEVSFDPEKQIRFEGKDSLKKTVVLPSGVNENNYEEYLVGAIEGTLSAEETEELEVYLTAHSSVREELDLLRKTILEPETEIVFERKASLKKSVLVTEANFAEYAVAFLDGELKGEDLSAFNAFVAAHPAMKAELELFSATKLQPDASVVFEDKASLKRKSLVVNAENFDETAVASIEGQLNAVEEKVFAAYLAANPVAEKTFALYSQTKLQPDTTIVFADKASLRHKERGAFWWNSTGLRYAAAAAVLLFIAIFFWSRGGIDTKEGGKNGIANNGNPKKNSGKNNLLAPVDSNSSPVIVPESNSGNSELAHHYPVHTHPTLPPVQHVKEDANTIATAVNYLTPNGSQEQPEFSDAYFNSLSASAPSKQGSDAITPGQFAMRWMKDKLDRRPELGEEESEDMVASTYHTNNENKDVSGFDLTSSAVNRIGNATGSRLHLSKKSEGTVLTIGKYDILLSKN